SDLVVLIDIRFYGKLLTYICRLVTISILFEHRQQYWSFPRFDVLFLLNQNYFLRLLLIDRLTSFWIRLCLNRFYFHGYQLNNRHFILSRNFILPLQSNRQLNYLIVLKAYGLHFAL